MRAAPLNFVAPPPKLLTEAEVTERSSMTSCFTVRTLAQARIAELKKRGQALGAPSMEEEAELRRLEVY
jgi:hypothetical protein